MKKKSSLREIIRTQLAEHFELFLTVAGVLATISVVLAHLERRDQGLLLIFVVWFQGFIIWAVRRHAWLRRRALMHKLRVMLQDRINNQLTVMLGAAEFHSREMTAAEREELETAVAAAKTVSEELENLSLESLRSWERHYGRFLPRALR
ncbi:MAG: hypothetical protein ACREMX_15980 [Gemmatimonadales bacterium]